MFIVRQTVVGIVSLAFIFASHEITLKSRAVAQQSCPSHEVSYYSGTIPSQPAFVGFGHAQESWQSIVDDVRSKLVTDEVIVTKMEGAEYNGQPDQAHNLFIAVGGTPQNGCPQLVLTKPLDGKSTPFPLHKGDVITTDGSIVLTTSSP